MNDFVLRATVGFVAGMALAIAWVLAQRGFGVYDLVPFAVWSLGFGAWMGGVARLFREVVHRPPGRARLVAIAALGLAAALVWTVLVRWMLGPWVGAFSFPVAWIWAVAGIVTLAPGGVAENEEP